jgi:hypothetical protein
VTRAKTRPSIYNNFREPLGGRPSWEGLVTWPINYGRYTEWVLLHRGYILRPSGWLTGFYHFNREGISPGGTDFSNLDEDGYNEVCFTPVGEQKNDWAEWNWKANYSGIYGWYMNENESRPYYWGSILFIKNDVYVHTGETYNTPKSPYEEEE